ncbi:lipase family protein [Bradyrhizobium yuanmingense]|uniref:lipase family protein n=1 Tax=Bradyrhizobium yuanmingense TaxID=108015 RepID=UPI0021A4082D|nr:lipase family protein [Bradyrhizobium sp. CB1024]UWU83192.1 lipase family protein [Bradyrhizobium sp. CB1024]
MIDRRCLLALLAMGATIGSLAYAQSISKIRLVLVHGRGQQGLKPETLKSEWLQALRQGAAAIGRTLPNDLSVAFPFYGDDLQKFVDEFNLPLASEIHAKGTPEQDEYLAFQAEVAEAIRQRSGVTDMQVDVEYGQNPKPKGPLNWEWVQAILQAVDKHGGGMSQGAIEAFTRDVFLYVTRNRVRDTIDQIVSAGITDEPSIVVGHSLGSVVAYNVLRTDQRKLRVPLLLTVGSPLGIRAIRDQFRPLRFPLPVKHWYNAFDERDVVALFPLDASNFAVTPQIENYGLVRNKTSNRHGIVGYLDDQQVAGRLIEALAA